VDKSSLPRNCDVLRIGGRGILATWFAERVAPNRALRRIPRIPKALFQHFHSACRYRVTSLLQARSASCLLSAALLSGTHQPCSALG